METIEQALASGFEVVRECRYFARHPEFPHITKELRGSYHVDVLTDSAAVTADELKDRVARAGAGE